MTALARRVLADCHIALRLLEDEAQEDNWSVNWAGALALICCVNDVLKLEKRRSALRKAYEKRLEAWNDKSSDQHAIFREFIKSERNLLLQEYRTNVDTRREVPIFVVDGTPAYFSPDTSAPLSVETSSFALDQNIFRPMKVGRWSNEDVRDVYSDALVWWKEQLDSIDKEVDSVRAIDRS